MAEPRKIVLILGNGFDLDIGLKTSYKDFWESEFCPKDYPAPLIRHLNKQWKEGKDAVRWYDLENELHSYAKNADEGDVIDEEQRSYIMNHTDYELSIASSYTGIDEVFSSLVEADVIKIAGVLRRASIPYRDDLMESAIWRDRKAFALIKKGLCNYLSSLDYESLKSSSMARALLEILKHSVSQGNLISIYSFNYTPTLSRYNQSLGSIVKSVHGSCDSSSIIIGTGDTLDISNDYDFLIKSFDASYNPPALVEDLQNTDEVIIFGHSIGKNDRMYFKAFFKQQVDYSCPRRKDITIFTRDEESEIQIKRALLEMTDGNLSALYGLNNIHLFHTSKLDSEEEKMRDLILRQNINKDKVSELLCFLHD